MLDGNDAGWVLRALLKSANFAKEQIARPVALSNSELDTLGFDRPESQCRLSEATR